MVFLEAAEFLFAFILVAVIVLQVIVPIMMNRPIFPLFKKKNRKVEQELAGVKEELDLAEKQKEIDALREELEIERKKHG